MGSELKPKHEYQDPKKRGSLCVGCGCPITDQYILRVAPDLEWHASCLKCADCSQALDETCTCFVREGKTYCKRDYVKLFGAKCAKCGSGFSKNDFVMRARNKIFHIDCFCCVACNRHLIPGDEFALREDGLFCKADNEIVEKASNNNNTTSPVGTSPPGSVRCPSPDDVSENIVPEDNAGESDSRDGSSSNGSNGGSRSRSSSHKEHKTTRVRTVLNEKQLHTLRTCYNANPRPDALMKEQLVEMTGLSPRVIRVWFQNKRCKDKKRAVLVKQMQDQQQQKSANGLSRPLQGVPMVASSPVRHESQMPGNPVEVQSYQQPSWKALTEFGMHADLDQPPFQQLVNSFDQPDANQNQMGFLPPDDLNGPLNGHLNGHPPNSVGSELGKHHLHHKISSDIAMDMADYRSEMSSPLSQ